MNNFTKFKSRRSQIQIISNSLSQDRPLSFINLHMSSIKTCKPFGGGAWNPQVWYAYSASGNSASLYMPGKIGFGMVCALG
jgi:hypothetical protein